MKRLQAAAGVLLGAILFFGASLAAGQDADLRQTTQAALDLLSFNPDETPTEDPERIAEGLPLLDSAAAAGDGMAQNALGVAYFNGLWGLEPDPARALELYESAINAEDEKVAMVASLNWALMQAETDQAARAVELFERVRRSDTELAPLAAMYLGQAYAFGHGVEVDLPRAGRLYQEAVESSPGDVQAHYMLARGYEAGWYDEGVQLERAFEHYQAAADLGDSRAAWKVGMAHLNGAHGLTPDSATAYAWFRSSAEGGHIDGMISTAVMLATGDGVELDPRAAAGWYSAAAQIGSAHALRGLGVMIAFQEIDEGDPLNGVAMVAVAAERGDDVAPQIMRVLDEQLDPEQRRRLIELKVQVAARYPEATP